MIEPIKPSDEERRLQTLRELDILVGQRQVRSMLA
jgi:hypothetical protein